MPGKLRLCQSLQIRLTLKRMEQCLHAFLCFLWSSVHHMDFIVRRSWKRNQVRRTPEELRIFLCGNDVVHRGRRFDPAFTLRQWIQSAIHSHDVFPEFLPPLWMIQGPRSFWFWVLPFVITVGALKNPLRYSFSAMRATLVYRHFFPSHKNGGALCLRMPRL